MNRASVLMEMEQCDVFIFPSFEGAGMVVIEAMAKGLPVVCLDFGGPGEYVTADCGIKVPLTEPENVIMALSNALTKLASDKVLYERLSAGAIERVKENYLWDRVGDKLNTIIRIFSRKHQPMHILNSHPNMPDLYIGLPLSNSRILIPLSSSRVQSLSFFSTTPVQTMVKF